MESEIGAIVTKQSNPLRVIATVSVLSLVVDLYQFLAVHHGDWVTALRTSLSITFLAFYVAKSRFAWTAALISCTGMTPAYLLLLYIISPRQFPSLRVICVMTAMSFGVAVFIFRLRTRYYLYLTRTHGWERKR
jgi:hypothetical protein